MQQQKQQLQQQINNTTKYNNNNKNNNNNNYNYDCFQEQLSRFEYIVELAQETNQIDKLRVDWAAIDISYQFSVPYIIS